MHPRDEPVEVSGDVIFVGDDWSEAHHDVYVCDPDGEQLARQRIAEGLGPVS